MRTAVVRRYPARRRCRRLPRSRDRCACRTGGRSRSRDRSRRGDRGSATPRRKRTRPALPARPLVKPAHDLAPPRHAGVGVRLRLLARPRGGVLHPPRHARTGLLVPLALLFLCAGAAAAALPIGPAGAATQAGAGTAALAAAGIGGRRRLLPLSPWAPWGSSPGQQSCSSPLPGAPDGCWCPLGPQPEDAPRGVHRVVGGDEAIPAQSATARPRPSASALAGGEVVRELSPESRGPGPAWCGINRVPMWDSLAFL
jgi:hypothetical protein